MKESHSLVQQFAKLLIPWVEEVLQWGPNDGLAGFEAIETPWYEERPGEHIEFHLTNTLELCERLVELVSQLSAEPPLDVDGLELALMEISPFNFGPLVEIRYMAYHFGPLYMSIMTKFLKYRGAEELSQAHGSKLFWEDDLSRVTTVPAPRMATLERELKRKGKLKSQEIRATARWLLEVFGCVNAILIWSEHCRQYVQEPPWVGLVAFQAACHDLQAKLVRFEALWGMYECSWWHSPGERI